MFGRLRATRRQCAMPSLPCQHPAASAESAESNRGQYIPSRPPFLNPGTSLIPPSLPSFSPNMLLIFHPDSFHPHISKPHAISSTFQCAMQDVRCTNSCQILSFYFLSTLVKALVEHLTFATTFTFFPLFFRCFSASKWMRVLVVL